MPKLTDLELRSAYHKLSLAPEGEIVIEDLKALCRLMKLSFATDNLERVDTHGIAFNEGKRSVILYILDMIIPPDKQEKREGKTEDHDPLKDA